MSATSRFCAGLFFALSLSSAQAEELAGGGEPLRILDISPEVCTRLAPYISTGDADFKPGVAADGSAVAPADLDDGYTYKPPMTYRFPLKVKPLAGTGAPYDSSDLYVADVLFDLQTGRVSVDGQDVSGGDRALAEACAHRGGR